jgi:hypothetical protein
MIRSSDIWFFERIMSNEMNAGFIGRHCQRSDAQDQDRIASSLRPSQ